MPTSRHTSHSWSRADLATLQGLYGRTPTEDLVPLLNRSAKSIESRARDLGLRKNKRLFPGGRMPRWTEDEIQTLINFYPTTPNVEIAAHLGRSLKSITNKGNSLGLLKDEERMAAMGRENVAHRTDRRSAAG